MSQSIFSMSLKPDPWNEWYYDTKHPEYNSDYAKDWRRRREQTLAACDPRDIQQARENDERREREKRDAPKQGR